MEQDMILSMVENLITGVCAFELKDYKLTPVYCNEGLSRMLGYSRTDIDRYLKNIRFCILPEDLPVFDQGISDVLKADGPVDIEFRTVTGKGALRWLQVRANLYSKSGDTYLIVCVIIDVTETKSAEEELRTQAERMNLVFDSSKDKVLDYNAKTDVLTIRMSGENSKGNEMIIPSYIENFDLLSFHPDDAEHYLDILQGLLVSAKTEVLEVRNRRFDNDYVWYQMTLTSIIGVEGYVTRIVGRMINIQENKIRELALKAMSFTDGLTQIYNRSAVQKEINDFLQQAEQENEVHALMIIDLDNFKVANEHLGHSVGDRILKECASVLHQSFQRKDIIGRIGGDEFVVLVKDLHTISHADLIASKLVNKLRWQLPCEETTISVTGSIGIAMFPYHGINYEELFDKADLALDSAKANGKQGYQLYNSAITRAFHISRKEENYSSVTEYHEEQTLQDMVMHILYEDKLKNSALMSVLEIILARMDWHRGYWWPSLQQLSEGDNLIQAYMPGYEFGENNIEEQNQVASALEDLYEQYDHFMVIDEYEPTDIPEELRQYMIIKKIKKLYYYPFTLKGQYSGCVTFEDYEANKDELNAEELSQLKNVLRMVDACSVQFGLDNSRVRDLITQLEMLDNLNTFVYLIDVQTHELKFVNKKVLSASSELKLGGFCHDIMCSQNAPCSDCIIRNLDSKDVHAVCSRDAFSYSLRTWINESASWFECNKNSQVCMIIGTDISKYFIC